MNRLALTKIHMLLASFMFPVAIMFLVTGALYTWGIKGSYEDRDYTVTLSEPLVKDANALKAVAAAELTRQGIAPPTGAVSVSAIGDAYRLTWSGSNRDVQLTPTGNALEAQLTVKDTTWYRALVQLHKAKGGTLFKVYAAVFALGLFVLLASGFILAWQIPAFRRGVQVSSVAGVLVFVGMVASG